MYDEKLISSDTVREAIDASLHSVTAVHVGHEDVLGATRFKDIPVYGPMPEWADCLNDIAPQLSDSDAVHIAVTLSGADATIGETISHKDFAKVKSVAAKVLSSTIEM